MTTFRKLIEDHRDAAPIMAALAALMALIALAK